MRLNPRLRRRNPPETELHRAPFDDTRSASLLASTDGAIRVALIDTSTGQEFASLPLADRSQEELRRVVGVVAELRERLAAAAPAAPAAQTPPERGATTHERVPRVDLLRDGRSITIRGDRRQDVQALAGAAVGAVSGVFVIAEESHAEPVTMAGRRWLQRLSFLDVTHARAAWEAARGVAEHGERLGAYTSQVAERDPIAGTVPLPPSRQPPAPRSDAAPARERLPPFGVYMLRVPAETWSKTPPKAQARILADTHGSVQDGALLVGPTVGARVEGVVSALRQHVLSPAVEVEDQTAAWTVVADPPAHPAGIRLHVPGHGPVAIYEAGFPQANQEPFVEEESSILAPDGKHFRFKPLQQTAPEQHEARTEFDVLTDLLPDLLAKLERYAAKATKLGQPPPTLTKIGEPFVKAVSTMEEIPNPYGDGTTWITRTYPHRVQRVQLSGLAPHIKGWRIAGVLTPTESGENIVMPVAVPRLPERFRFSGTICEHCNVQRLRSKVYVLENERDHRMLQVGRSCLADFTGHPSPEALATLAETAIKLLSEFEDGERGGSGREHGQDPRQFLERAAHLVLRYGYVSGKAAKESGGMSTATQTGIWLRGRRDQFKSIGVTPDEVPSPAAIELARNSLAWAQSLPSVGLEDYLNSLRLIASQDAFFERDYGFAASMISAYQRAYGLEQERRRQAETMRPPQHVGTLGASWSGVVNVVVSRYYGSDETQYPFHLVVGLTPEGDRVVWRSSASENPEVGNTVKVRSATVKEHKYREGRGGEQVPDTRVSNVNAWWAPIVRGKEAWKYTRGEWMAIPEVAGAAEYKRIERELPDVPNNSDTFRTWAASQGTNSDTLDWVAKNRLRDGPYAEWLREANAPLNAAMAALEQAMARDGIDSFNALRLDLPDQATVVRQAYAEGLPVPPQVLADFPAEVASVDAERRAAEEVAAAKAARAAARGKGAPAAPATAAEKALAGPMGSAVRAVLDRFAAASDPNLVFVPPSVGMSTTSTKDVVAGETPTSPFIVSVQSLPGRSRRFARRVILAPDGVILQSGSENAHGGWSYNRDFMHRTPLAYDLPIVAELAAQHLKGRRVFVPGVANPATERDAALVMERLLDLAASRIAVARWHERERFLEQGRYAVGKAPEDPYREPLDAAANALARLPEADAEAAVERFRSALLARSPEDAIYRLANELPASIAFRREQQWENESVMPEVQQALRQMNVTAVVPTDHYALQVLLRQNGTDEGSLKRLVDLCARLFAFLERTHRTLSTLVASGGVGASIPGALDEWLDWIALLAAHMSRNLAEGAVRLAIEGLQFNPWTSNTQQVVQPGGSVRRVNLASEFGKKLAKERAAVEKKAAK